MFESPFLWKDTENLPFSRRAVACIHSPSASEIRAVWSVQPHVDLGEFIGSSETEEPALAMPDVGRDAGTAHGPLAMWEAGVQHIELEKGSKGLGFSILDYQVNPTFRNAFKIKDDIYKGMLWITGKRQVLF